MVSPSFTLSRPPLSVPTRRSSDLALEREIQRDLGHVAWAPRVNLSALTGRHAERLVPAIETALDSWDSRIPTGRLNAFLGSLVAAHPHPLRGGKQPRILRSEEHTSELQSRGQLVCR